MNNNRNMNMNRNTNRNMKINRNMNRDGSGRKECCKISDVRGVGQCG